MCIGKSREFGLYFTDSGACECEMDCKKVCEGCDKYFCEIKNIQDLRHDEELPESLRTSSGAIFCGQDCFESYYS